MSLKAVWFATFAVLMAATVLVPRTLNGDTPGAASRIPKRYLLPTWYTGRLDPRVEGERVIVKARLQVGLVPMRKAHVTIEPGSGLELVSVTVTEAPGAGSRASSFDGDLAAGQACELRAMLVRKRGASHGFVNLAVDYEFPAEELLAYIADHRKDLYPDDDLRRLLQETIVKSHRGRVSEGVTERVEFEAGGVR